MIHARKDYMHIQDKTGKVGKEEPVFLLRAKDSLAPLIIEEWAQALETKEGDPVAVAAARQHAILMREWQAENGCKFPDTPENEVSIAG